MPAKTRDVDRMLCRKLGARKQEGGKHATYRIVDGDEIIATTALSRGVKEIDDSLLGTMARNQLRISPVQLRQLIDCTLSREDYITIVGRR